MHTGMTAFALISVDIALSATSRNLRLRMMAHFEVSYRGPSSGPRRVQREHELRRSTDRTVVPLAVGRVLRIAPPGIVVGRVRVRGVGLASTTAASGLGIQIGVLRDPRY